MATGLAATAYAHNLPPEGTFVANSALFARETERNEMPLEVKPIGLGAPPFDLRIPNVGVLASLRLVVKGTLRIGGTAAGGTNATRYGWPWNLLERVSLNIQGQTSLTTLQGQDLRARRQRFYRNPKEDVSTAPGTDADTRDPIPGSAIAIGDSPVTLVYDIPIVHDPYTLAGAVYAQSDAVYLNWRIQPASVGQLFTLTGDHTVELVDANVHTTMTFYDVPQADVQGKGRVVLLPDMRWLHGLFSADKPFANTGEVETEIIRTDGQLLSLGVYLDNGGETQIDPSDWEQLAFRYGGNRSPRVFSPMEAILEKNTQDYNGRIRPGYVFLDFEVDNPEREIVYPKGVTELVVVPRIPTGQTVNANARTHVVYETLFAGA